MLFAKLEIEAKLQVKDKTRLDASKAFSSRDSDPISTMTIQAGDDATAVNVFNSTIENRFLDWQFSDFKADIDANRNVLEFKENDGAILEATITPGTYTLATLAAEIETQLEAAGSLLYSVTASSDDKITITVDTADSDISLLPTRGNKPLLSILPFIGFTVKPGHGDDKYSREVEVTGDRARSLPRNITLTIGNGTDTDTAVEVMQVYSVEGDHLFSSDADMLQYQPDILRKVPPGRNSWLNMHRAAQELIVADLRKAGFVDVNSDPLTVSNIVDREEVKEWSLFRALRLTLDFISVSTDDVQYEEARDYAKLEKEYAELNFLRLDVNNDGKADPGEGVTMAGARLMRR